jgi:uncharacterized protein YbcI
MAFQTPARRPARSAGARAVTAPGEQALPSGRPVASGPEAPTPAGKALNQAISDSVVRVHARFAGRGATTAQAFHVRNVVVVIMRGALTGGERALLASGREDAVRALRRELHEVMRVDVVAAVERLTGCAVEVRMSGTQVDPDVVTELFVLDHPIGGGPAAARHPSPRGANPRPMG